MSWYEDWFSSDAYDLVYAHRDLDEAEQCIDLIQREVQPHPRAHILDVGCGRGRHALILEVAEHGGHCGFVENYLLRSWLERRIAAVLADPPFSPAAPGAPETAARATAKSA